MKKLTLILLPAFFLAACASKTPTQAIIDDARNQIGDISKDLSKMPKECNPEAYTSRLKTVSTTISSIETSWKADMANKDKNISHRNYLIILLIVGILSYLGYKIYKWAKKVTII